MHSEFSIYSSGLYPCAYLPDRTACSQVVSPAHAATTDVYAILIRQGFRRSGYFIYRPACENCQECVSVRIPVKDFSPNRSQRRTERQHQGLTIGMAPLDFQEEHYQLYCRYQQSRHPGSGMDEDTRQQYGQFLLRTRVDSRLLEFRLHGELCMLALTDFLPDGLSAVYTFYDAQIKGLGTYAILRQVELARSLRLPYLYLGYWIRSSDKMHYKSNFQPLQYLHQGLWQSAPPTPPIENSLNVAP